MNQSRCCAYDSGKACSRLTLTTGASTSLPALRSLSTTSASPATVGLSNISLSATSTSSTSLILDTTCVASSECPPSSKKLSLIPTLSLFSTSAHMPDTISSTAVLACCCCCWGFSLLGCGRAFRSSLPFGVRGISPISTYAQGTMYSGNRFCRCSLSSSLLRLCPSPITTYATSRFCPGSSSLAITAHCLTPSCSLNTPSISPNSILYPRTFTCSSILPMYSNSPSLPHLTKSPVLYNLSPVLPLIPSGTYLLAVSSALSLYPLPTPSPPMCNSPAIASPSISLLLPTTYSLVFVIPL